MGRLRVLKKNQKTKPPSFCSGKYAAKHWCQVVLKYDGVCIGECGDFGPNLQFPAGNPNLKDPCQMLLLLPFLVTLQWGSTWVLCRWSYAWCLSLCKWISPSSSCLLDLIVLVLRTVFVISEKYLPYNWFLFLSPASAFHVTFRGIMAGHQGFFFSFLSLRPLAIQPCNDF